MVKTGMLLTASVLQAASSRRTPGTLFVLKQCKKLIDCNAHIAATHILAATPLALRILCITLASFADWAAGTFSTCCRAREDILRGA